MRLLIRYFLLISILFSCKSISSFAQDITNIKNEKPFAFSGALSLHTNFYTASGIDPRKKNFSWYLTGSPLVKIYGVDVPFSFVVSEQERKFRQPFNQFGIAPTYKWVKVYLGFHNITWSQFTWAGQTALGAGVELKPKKFRFGFLIGRLNRAVVEDTLSKQFQTPAFKRTGYAMQIGFGTDTNHVDFIFLKAKDILNSLSYVPLKSDVLPSENTVLGFSSKQRLSKKIFWDAEIAASGYTRDVRSTAFSGDGAAVVKSFNPVLNVNASTQAYKALQTELRYVTKKFKLKLKYKRVDPDYKSMGAYFFQSDAENITLNPSFNVAKNKLRFDASIGHQRDNLLHKKSYTTSRLISSIGFGWSPIKQFGVNISYSNYKGDQAKGILTPVDTLKQSFVSQNFTATPRLIFSNKNFTHFFLFVYNKQWFNDNNKKTEKFTSYQSNTSNFSYSLSMTKLNATFTASYLINSFVLDTNVNKLNGFNISGSKSFLQNKFSSNINIGSSTSKRHNIETASILNVALGGNYKFKSNHGFSIQINYMNNNSKDANQKSFSELNIDLGYTYTFH